MKAKTQKTVLLGDLVARAFDEAARQSADPKEVSRLATRAVIRLMRRARRPSAPPRPAPFMGAANT